MIFDFLGDFLTNLAQFTQGLDAWLQGFFVVLLGAIPFVESYGGTFVGIVAGVSPILAVVAAIIGNVICTFALMFAALKTRTAVLSRRGGGANTEPEMSKRRAKVAKALDQYGVPGVCFLGPLLVASQITAPTLIAVGARPGKVFLFQGLAIVAWGVLFALLGNLLLTNVAG